jgi:hypothetical protein
VTVRRRVVAELAMRDGQAPCLKPRSEHAARTLAAVCVDTEAYGGEDE